MNWNNYLFQKIHSLVGRSSFLDAVGIFLAEYLTYFIIAGLIFWIFSKPSKRAMFSAFSLVFLSVLFSRGIITEGIRFFYKAARPFTVLGFEPLISETNPSFPSGHTSLLLAIAFAVFLLNRKAGIWFGVLGLIVGLARIYVGVHWPIDILGGIVVAFIGTYIANILLKKFGGDNHNDKAYESSVV